MPTSTTTTEIQEKLRREQWTAVAVDDITVNDFKGIDQILDEINDADDEAEVLSAIEDQLDRNAKSISALYGLSIIRLKQQSIDDSNLIELLDIFEEHKRWGILEYLCDRFLQYGENRYILQKLAVCYEQSHASDKLVTIWERLIRIDYSDTSYVLHLAEFYKNNNNTLKSIEYYKKFLLRSVNGNDFLKIQTGWQNLITIIPHEIDFFIQVEHKVGKKYGSSQAVLLLESLYPIYKKEKDFNNAIFALKRIFAYQPENIWGRKEIVENYRLKYGAHSNLEDFIRFANISQSWRNIHEAIADFEKHISFDVNTFVFHRSWGVGIIREIAREKITIDFTKNKAHEMSLKMAMTALETLSKNHIWVLRSVFPREKLREMVKTNVGKTLKIIINSFGNAVTMKKVRSELVPYILSDNEWTSWSIKARKVLKTDGIFGTVSDLPDHFEVRTHRSTIIEKVYNSFVAEKQFSNRIRCVIDFIKIPTPSLDGSDSELLREIAEYFANYLRHTDQDIVRRVSSLLLIRMLSAKYSHLQSQFHVNKYSLAQIVNDSSLALSVCQHIDNKDLFNYYLLTISEELDDTHWTRVYLNILRRSPSKTILDKLEKRGKSAETLEIIRNIITNYRTHRESFIWLLAHQHQYPFIAEAMPTVTNATMAMAHLFDVNATDIANKRNLINNRKLQKQINKFLYKDNNLDTLIATADEDIITQIIPILHEIQKIEPAKTIAQKEKIQERFPYLIIEDLKRSDMRAIKETPTVGFYTLQSSFVAKQLELQNIHEVEVPKNSKEIQQALEKGDLKENAEYKSAKEHQEILNAHAMRLETELRNAKIFSSDQLNTDTISFGTDVALTDLVTNKLLQYSILGPWESNPDKNIISYLSPLGEHLCNHAIGEELKFQINDIDYHLKVNTITQSEPLAHSH